MATAVVILGWPRVGRAADGFANGQHVEVREGDQWSPASVTGHEGRKYHVHYDGSTAADDEWVTPDRLRVPGGATPAPAPTVSDKAADKATPAPTAPAGKPSRPKLKFVIKDHVEVKWGGLYRAATVVNTRDGWYLIAYDNTHSDWGWEWVESDRVRSIGSTDDPIGYATIHNYHRGDGPPAGPSTVGTDEDQTERRKAADDAATAHEAATAHDATPTPSHARRGRSHASDDAGPAVARADLTRPDSTVGPGDKPLVKPDLSAGKDVEPVAVEPGAVPADPAPTASPPRNLSLNHGPPQAGTQTGLVVTPAGHWAALTFHPGGDADPVSVQLLDLGRDDCDALQSLTNDVMPLAVSPDGHRLVTRSDRGHFGGTGGLETRWRLDVWDVNATVPKPLLSFRPYDPADTGADAVDWATYLDATHLITCSGRHVVTLWAIDDKAATVKEVYTLAGDETVRPRLSGGGKYVVAGFGGCLVVCDAMTGRCVAKVADPDAANDGLALRSDVKRLALTGGRRLVVLDLEHDAVVTDLGLPPETLGAEVAWVGPDLLLVDDRLVYDLARHRVVWEYALPPGVRRTFGQSLPRTVGDRIWYVTETPTDVRRAGASRMTIGSAAVPDAHVADAQRKLAAAGTGDGEFAVGPGRSVSLEVSTSAGTEEQRKQVADRFRQQLEADGLTWPTTSRSSWSSAPATRPGRPGGTRSRPTSASSTPTPRSRR